MSHLQPSELRDFSAGLPFEICQVQNLLSARGASGDGNRGHIAKISLIGLYDFLVTFWGYLDGKTSFGGPRSVSISYQID